MLKRCLILGARCKCKQEEEFIILGKIMLSFFVLWFANKMFIE